MDKMKSGAKKIKDFLQPYPQSLVAAMNEKVAFCDRLPWPMPEDLCEKLMDAVEKLPEKTREALLLRFRDHLTMRKIGERMNLSDSYVSFLIRRGLHYIINRDRDIRQCIWEKARVHYEEINTVASDICSSAIECIEDYFDHTYGVDNNTVSAMEDKSADIEKISKLAYRMMMQIARGYTGSAARYARYRYEEGRIPMEYSVL